MTRVFTGPLAVELDGFLRHKRARGYRYARAEFTLRSFDRFLASTVRRKRRWCLDEVILAWLANHPNRKAISVSSELTVVREFWRYLHRREPRRFRDEPRWPLLPTEPRFAAHILTHEQILTLLRLAAELDRPKFRADLCRVLLLVLYCTGLRLGEAVRIRHRDLDLDQAILFVAESKGRSRWVPFHASLALELQQYLRARHNFTGRSIRPDDPLLVDLQGRELSVRKASDAVRALLRRAGFKPGRGRVGPRPHDLRHTFAVHRLSAWYLQGTDLHECLPWLSAYLGHVDLVGTEVYLAATPELLELAGERLRRRYSGRRGAA